MNPKLVDGVDGDVKHKYKSRKVKKKTKKNEWQRVRTVLEKQAPEEEEENKNNLTSILKV